MLQISKHTRCVNSSYVKSQHMVYLNDVLTCSIETCCYRIQECVLGREKPLSCRHRMYKTKSCVWFIRCTFKESKIIFFHIHRNFFFLFLAKLYIRTCELRENDVKICKLFPTLLFRLTRLGFILTVIVINGICSLEQ